MTETAINLREMQEYSELREEALRFAGQDHAIDESWLSNIMATFALNKLRQEREKIADLAEELRKVML